MKDYASFVLDYFLTIPSGQISWHEYTSVLLSQYMPGSFDWVLFSSGVVMHVAAIVTILLKNKVQDLHRQADDSNALRHV